MYGFFLSERSAIFKKWEHFLFEPEEINETQGEPTEIDEILRIWGWSLSILDLAGGDYIKQEQLEERSVDDILYFMLQRKMQNKLDFLRDKRNKYLQK